MTVSFSDQARAALRHNAWTTLIIVDGMDVSWEGLDPLPVPGWQDAGFAVAISVMGLLNDLALSNYSEQFGYDPRSRLDWAAFLEQNIRKRIRSEFRPSLPVLLRIYESAAGWPRWTFRAWPNGTTIGTLLQIMSISRDELRDSDAWDISRIFQTWESTVLGPPTELPPVS